MKRALFATLVFAALILAGAAYVYAQEDSSSLIIRPSEMKDGETKTFIDDGNKITVKRNGDTINVDIEGADSTKRLTIVKTGDSDIRIERDGQRVIVAPPRIRIEGLPELREKRREMTQQWFECPKDGTMLRVPKGKEDETYRCPVDGTAMEKKKGRGYTIWWGDGVLEGTSL
jgi:hypothetical protein